MCVCSDYSRLKRLKKNPFPEDFGFSAGAMDGEKDAKFHSVRVRMKMTVTIAGNCLTFPRREQKKMQDLAQTFIR